PDAQAGGAAGEPSVGDEQDVLAETGALDSTGDGEHLTHPRAALGPLVADDHDVAGDYRAFLERVHGGALSVEDAGYPTEDVGVEAGGLHHGTARCEGALQDRETAGAVDRVVHRPEDLAVQVGGWHVRQVLRNGASGHREAVAVQQAGVEQRLHHDRDAADTVHVDHDVLPERLDVGQVRHLGADPAEVGERELDPCLVGDGQQVQHRVGRPTEGHHHGDRVLERLLGHDLPGGDAAVPHAADRPAGGPGAAAPPAV